MNGLSLLEHISVINDPRQSWKVEHKLYRYRILTVAAVIAGSERWESIQDFCQDNLEWLERKQRKANRNSNYLSLVLLDKDIHMQGKFMTAIDF